MEQSRRKNYVSNIILCVIYSTICGIITGLIVFGFKYAIKHIETFSRTIYETTKESYKSIIIVFVVLIVLAFLMYLLHRLIPSSKGGGIPRSEGVLRGILSFKWLRTFIGSTIGSFISVLSGVPVGTEGPSVILGTSIGDAVTKKSKKRPAIDRYVKTSGAAAGFAVATGAPLSGILFTLEEIHKRFTPMLIMSASMSVIFASLVNNVLCELCNMDPRLFHIEFFSEFKLNHILYLILLGIIIGVLVFSFDKVIEIVNKFTDKYGKIFHPLVKLIILFIITGILGFVFIEGIYSGHHIVEEMITNNKSIIFLLILVLIRFIMMCFVTDSSVTGGIFIPILAIASIVGAILGKGLILIGLEEEYFSVIVILTMCAFMGGTLRAPLTATVLFLELTGQFTDLFYAIIVIFIVNAITEIFGLHSFYELRLEKLEEEQNHGKTPKIALFQVQVSENSFVVGKSVRDVMWPYASTVISVRRYLENDKDTDNDGEKKIYANDTIVIRCKYYDEEEIKELIYGLVGKNHQIKIKEA